MSASIIAYWPGVTEEQVESQWAEFNNDYQDWANWMAEGLQEPEVLAAMKRAGVLPLATMTGDGVSDDEVLWVAPADLRNAAARLSRLIDEGNPDAVLIMGSYGTTANYGEDLTKHFQQDLHTVEALAASAQEQDVRKMTLSTGDPLNPISSPSSTNGRPGWPNLARLLPTEPRHSRRKPATGSKEYVRRILEAMSAVLEPEGFRKKGLVFTAQREDMIWLVELRKGKWTTAQEAIVSLHYGVFSPELEEAISRVCDRVDWAEEWRPLGIPAPLQVIMKARGFSDKETAPTRGEGCHWTRYWPGHSFWGLSELATASNNEQAEWAAEEIAWQIRETVLSALERRTPASRLLDQLCEKPRGLGSIWGYQGLMEWAAAHGKLVNYDGEILTEENFERLVNPPRPPANMPKPVPPPSPQIDLEARKAEKRRLAGGAQVRGRDILREGLRVRLARRKTWYFRSSGYPDQIVSVPAGAVGALYEMASAWSTEARRGIRIRVIDAAPGMRAIHTAYAIWLDKHPSPTVQAFGGGTETAYFVIEGSDGDPLPPYLRVVDAYAASSRNSEPR